MGCQGDGYLLARLLLGTTNIGSLPVSGEPFSPGWRATIGEDFFTGWFRNSCKDLKIEPVLHRKIWELCFVLRCLDHFGKLRTGATALGFGCGTEPLPSLFASKGISVLTTDLEPSAQAAKGWIDTDQHATSLEGIWRPELVSRSMFDFNVSLRYADMNNIPRDLDESSISVGLYVRWNTWAASSKV